MVGDGTLEEATCECCLRNPEQPRPVLILFAGRYAGPPVNGPTKFDCVGPATDAQAMLISTFYNIQKGAYLQKGSAGAQSRRRVVARAFPALCTARGGPSGHTPTVGSS